MSTSTDIAQSNCLTSATIQNGGEVCILDTMQRGQPSHAKQQKGNVIDASVSTPDLLSSIIEAVGIQQNDELDTKPQTLEHYTLDKTNTMTDQKLECPKESQPQEKQNHLQQQQTTTEEIIAQLKPNRKMTITEDGDIEFVLSPPPTKMEPQQEQVELQHPPQQTTNSLPALPPINQQRIEIHEVEIISPNQCFPPVTLKDCPDNSDQQIITQTDASNLVLSITYPLQMETQITTFDGQTNIHLTSTSIPETLQFVPQGLTDQQHQVEQQLQYEDILEQLLQQFEESVDKTNTMTDHIEYKSEECPKDPQPQEQQNHMQKQQTNSDEVIAQTQQNRKMTITEDGDIEFVQSPPPTKIEPQQEQAELQHPPQQTTNSLSPINQQHIEIQKVEVLAPNQCFLPVTLKDCSDNSDQQIIAQIDANDLPLQMEIQPQNATVDKQTIMRLTPTSIPETSGLPPQGLTNTTFQSHQQATSQVISNTSIPEADTSTDIEDHVLPKFMIATVPAGSAMEIKSAPQGKQQQIVRIPSKRSTTVPQTPANIKKSEDGSFKCREHGCIKSFSKKEHLLRHLVSHSGSKMFSCDKCQILFSRKDNLNRHKKKHEDETSTANFVCQICAKSFAVEMNYIEHKQMHEKNISEATGTAVK